MNRPVYIYITPFFPSPSSWRGAYCYDFICALMRQNHYDVYVFKEGTGETYEINGVKVHTFPAKRLPSNIFPFLFNARNCKNFLKAVAHCGIKFEDIAVAHANIVNYAPYALALKNKNEKCMAVLHHHCLGSFGLNMGILRHCWLYNMIQYPILRKVHESIDLHLFISEASRRSFLLAPNTNWTIYDDYIRQMRGLPYRSVRIKHSLVLYNGIDSQVFKPEGKRSDKSIYCIGCVANFILLKDQITLLRAVKHMLSFDSINAADVKIMFIGSGRQKAACEMFASENGLNVEFLEERTHDLLADFYHQLDLFVLPSYFEGFGCVLAEANACGVPCMTCAGQGFDGLIPGQERDYWLFEPRNYVQLAHMISNQMKSRREQHLTKDLDIDKLVEQYVEVLRAGLKRSA